MHAVNQELERVRQALGGIPTVKQVATSWPKALEATPLILLLQAGESAEDYRDDGEYLTEVEWYVRVFCKREEQQRSICGAVYDTMTALGYVRTFRWDESAADVRQTVFRFQTTI